MEINDFPLANRLAIDIVPHALALNVHVREMPHQTNYAGKWRTIRQWANDRHGLVDTMFRVSWEQFSSPIKMSLRLFFQSNVNYLMHGWHTQSE